MNYHGHILMDKFVRPRHRIVDFRTWVSGIHPTDLKVENGAIDFDTAKTEAHKLLNDKFIVGHSLHHDFKSLEYDVDLNGREPKLRDLTRYPKYKNDQGQKRSLKNLTKDFL